MSESLNVAYTSHGCGPSLLELWESGGLYELIRVRIVWKGVLNLFRQERPG